MSPSYLTRVGIALREVRVVADVEAEIVSAVNELRRRFTYVFTTGGIGPTHDDVTTDAIAKAFEVDARVREDAVAAMRLQYAEEDLTAGAPQNGPHPGRGRADPQRRLPRPRL